MRGSIIFPQGIAEFDLLLSGHASQFPSGMKGVLLTASLARLIPPPYAVLSARQMHCAKLGACTCM